MIKKRNGILYLILIAGTTLGISNHTAYAGSASQDGMLNEARRMSLEEDEISAVETYARVEPAAGDSRHDIFSGPYIGGSVGYNFGSYDVNNGGAIQGDADLDGLEGGVFAGYGYGWKHNTRPGFYIGLEGGYEWSNAEGDINNVTFDKSHEWIATVRPGIMPADNTLAYGIVGYSRADFAAETGGDEDLYGLVLGLGGEADMIGSSSIRTGIRVEYTYTKYESATINGFDFDGHENEVKMGLVVRF